MPPRPFPDVTDPKPHVRLIQFEDEPTSTTRPVLLTKNLSPGHRLYIDVAPFGDPPQWVPAEVVFDVRAYLTRVRRLEA